MNKYRFGDLVTLCFYVDEGAAFKPLLVTGMFLGHLDGYALVRYKTSELPAHRRSDREWTIVKHETLD